MIAFRACLALICATSFFSAQISHAQTLDDHRSRVSQISSISAEKLIHSGVWLSTLEQKGGSDTLSSAAGHSLLFIPRIVQSGYDSSVVYDVSGFYSGTRKTRVNFLFNFSTETFGEIFSFGFDSGTSAAKVALSKALFVGYTRTISPSKNAFFTFSSGSWLGGDLSERPCIDTYDREYHCASLTAWSDYMPPTYHRNPYYIDAIFRLVF
jgi:hypothetical protein